MRTFNHLTQEERYHIYIEHKKKVSLGDIAKDMGRSKSTISRELRRIKATADIVISKHTSKPQRHLDNPKR